MPNRTLALFVCLLTPCLAAQEPRPDQPAPRPPAVETPQAPQVEPTPVTPTRRIQTQLGMRFAVATSKIRRAIISTNTPYGFAARSVAKGSLADQAGIAPGTIVLKVDGKPLREVGELAAVLEQAQAGQKLVLSCARRKTPARWLDRHPWQDFEATIVLPGAGKQRRGILV